MKILTFLFLSASMYAQTPATWFQVAKPWQAVFVPAGVTVNFQNIPNVTGPKLVNANAGTLQVEEGAAPIDLILHIYSYPSGGGNVPLDLSYPITVPAVSNIPLSINLPHTSTCTVTINADKTITVTTP